MKFAIIRTGGKQYKVAKGDVVKVEKIAGAKQDKTIILKEVLLVSDEDKATIGKPLVKGAKVTAKVLAEVERSKKLKTIKFKRKVRYTRHLGHRQQYTKLEIQAITN